MAATWGMFATLLVVVVNQVLKQTIVKTSPALKVPTKSPYVPSYFRFCEFMLLCASILYGIY